MLLAAQLAGVVLYPFMEDNFVGRALLSLFGVVVLWLVMVAVAHSPAATSVGLLLGAPATLLLLVQAATGSATLQPYSSALEALLYFYAAGALIMYMLRDHEVSRDELFAVGATFTLVAWGFAYAYTVCQAVEAGSFGQPRRWVDLLFLSVTTLTSVGLSDIAPLRAFARTLVMLEELAGVAYVAMLVSRVVGLTVMTRRD
jgi:ion channel